MNTPTQITGTRYVLAVKDQRNKKIISAYTRAGSCVESVALPF
jgi:hypothetical protein